MWQLLFLVCATLYMNGVRSEGRIVCYYTNWSVYRPGTAKFNPQNINPYLCTHLIYAFGGFTKDNQMKPFDKYQDIEQGGYAKFTGLKTYNKQLKTMIAIGGWNEASSRFSPLVANAERRQKFIKNILKFLRQNHFDGIDLDWEYPAHREGGKPRDRDNYAQFVQELRAEFERESEKTGRPRLLVTMAVPAGIEYIEKGYDIPKLNKYLDWFNVLTYDFHSSHEPSVNHHAPLYSLEEESEYNYDAELNIDYSIKFYLNAGADRDKLVLGIPTYGRSFTLINEESTEIGAPAESPGDQGDATREKGYLAYYEICQNIKEDPEWTVVQPNPNAMGPYAYRRNQWVGYDDEAIVRKKAQYVVDNGLGGIMFWAIDNDDFRGICTGKAYPLIEAAKDSMLDALGLGINEVSKPSAPQKPSRSRSRENLSSTRNRITTTEYKLTYAERKGNTKRTQTTSQTTRSRQQSTTTSAPTSIKLTEAEGSSLYIGGRTTTPPPPTTPDPGTDFKCEEEGFFQHPRDCKKYYWCLDSGPSGLGIVGHQFTCPSGLYFNPAADSCDFARNVPCKIKKSTTVAPITSTTSTTARLTSSYNRITAATSRPTTFFRTTPRTTTTTEADEEDIDYEEEDENSPSPSAKPKGFDKDSEEDPKVIKELIELIRKVGGIDELEKHLLRKDDGTISIKESSSSSSSSLTATTPASISKSLYEKVLSKPNALNSFRNRFTSTSSFRTTKTQTKTQDNTEKEETQITDSKSSGASAGFSKYSSVLRGNSRQGPQSEGLDKLSDFDGFLKEKKQYITINRNRGTKQTADDEEQDELSRKYSLDGQDENEEEEVEVNVQPTRKFLTGSTPSYSTIRRTRPSTTTEENEDQGEGEEKELTERKSYGSLNRSRVKATTELPEVTETSAGLTRYKYLERSRPTRPTTESSNQVADGKNEDDEDDDNESENQENTVHFKAVNIENTRDTQKETTVNTQRTYASIGRRTTISTTATPETETETSTSAARTITTTATATPTTSTKETPLTTHLTVLETTTPKSAFITTNIPITTTTNPTKFSTTTISTTKTTTTSNPNDEDVSKSLTTTSNSNEINSNISDSLELSQQINSLLTYSLSNSAPSPTTESSPSTNERAKDSQLTTTETTVSSTTAAITDSDNLTKTDYTEQEEKEQEVNVVSKQRNKTLYNTRARTTTTTSPTTSTTITTTTTNVDNETTSSPTITTNAKKTLGVRRQQILLNRSSQTKITSAVTTTTVIPTTTESVNNDFLGTVSSPRPFGFPKRRNRPIATAGLTTTTSGTTEEISKSNDDILVSKQKSTKLNAATNSQTKKYQFQRRTTTTTTTTSTTTAPIEADEDNNEENKSQVNLNDAYASERQTSTNIPQTTAPITTENISLTATPLPLQRRIKIVKLKRPVVSNINNTNTNITVNAIASSATNYSNASHTETQNIVKLSNSEIASQIAKIETLTETETTKTQTPIPAQTSPSPTPKHIRKVIRKIIRPLNRTTENAIKLHREVEKSNVTAVNKSNISRYGFNRSTKLKLTAGEESTNTEETKSDDEVDVKKKVEYSTKLGRNRFTLPSRSSTTLRASSFRPRNRSKFSNRLQPSSTTEDPKVAENSDEDEEDDEEYEEVEITTIAHYGTNRFKFIRPSTEGSTDLEDDNDSTESSGIETTTQFAEIPTNTNSSATTEQIVEQQQDVLNEDLRFNKTANHEEVSDDPLLKLRNKIKQDSYKVNQEEGILSARLKSSQVANKESELKLEDPLFKLRNKVQEGLSKTNQDDGVLNERLKFIRNESNVEDIDDTVLKLRDKVEQNLAEDSQGEDVMKEKPLDATNITFSPIHKVNDAKIELNVTKDSLNLQKLREKVQTNLAKSDQDEGILNSSLKKLLTEKNHSHISSFNESEDSDESEASGELKESSGDGDVLGTGKIYNTLKRVVPKTKLTSVDGDNQTQTPSTPAPQVRLTFRRKLVAKRPYIPNKLTLSTLSTTTAKAPAAKENKYVRRKFGTLPPVSTSATSTGLNTRGDKLPGTQRFKFEGAPKKEIKEYQEYDEEEDDEEIEEEEEEVALRPVQTVKPSVANLPGYFDRTQTTPLKKSPANSKEPGSGDSGIDDKEEEDEEEEEEVEEEEEEDGDDDDDGSEEANESPPLEGNKSITNHPSYKPKSNRVPPGARPALTTIPTIKKPFTPSRVANTPYRPNAVTAHRNKANRFGSTSKSGAKTRVANRPLGVSVPHLTIKPVANDFERTTVLIPTKPAPFINPNTRAYERKYTGPTTEPSADATSENNPLIEDLNIEALNARNKKIFDINSKKHTTLKPKLAKQNESTEEQQPETNTELENDENVYETTVDGFATTTTATITLNTNTTQSQQQQEHKQTTTLDNTIVGTQNTDDANQSNANNLNEISSQDGFTTTPPPSTTLLHIFTIPDGEHTTPNPLEDGFQVVPRLIVERVNPKHKVVEINRIVEVNSKEEKLRRKSKAHTIVPIEGSQTYKVESLPHIEQLGEISVVKFVHQVDGSDITIEGRSTVTDYTPTEPTVSGTSYPVRQSLPEGSSEKRYGKALLPEVIREASETSTISLEGLFETARKSKVLNTVDDATFTNQEAHINNKVYTDEIPTATESSNTKHVESRREISHAYELSTESFNIFKSIAFDTGKINWESNSKEIETKKNNLEPVFSTAGSSSSAAESEPEKFSFSTLITTTPAPEIPSQESTTAAAEDAKPTTVAQYVRPIVPLLRPESNESSPLVISIANLDKVILSKVKKTSNGVEAEEDEKHKESQTQPKTENKKFPNSQTETLKTNNSILNNQIDQIDETQTQHNSTIHDSQAAFSSRLASVLKAPLTNSLTQTGKKVSNVTKNPLNKAKQMTQTKLYTINEGSVGTTTSSTIGSKISETVSFSSETTVIRRKQPRKQKAKKFKNETFTTNAPAIEKVSES